MSRFFKPYEGKRPYVFISYAHLQSETVVDTIRILHEKKYRLWYDEGIPAGSDWPANIAQHMQDCERVIFFLSERAMESPNCYSEMRTACRLGKPVLVVRLEDTVPSADWFDLLEGQPTIPVIAAPQDRADAILNSKFLTNRFLHKKTENFSFRALGLAASLLFFLAAGGSFAALATGKWTPVKPAESTASVTTPSPSIRPSPAPVIEFGDAERFFAAEFPDSQQERAVKRALGVSSEDVVYRWQLANIKELYFCGNMITGGIENISFESDGTCRVNGSPVITGQVADLSLIESAVRLEKLALICQPLQNISALNSHLLLEELSLAGSSVSDISSLNDLPGLRTIRLEHTDVKDLSPLASFPALESVTVSRDMLPLKWDDDAGYSVILVN